MYSEHIGDNFIGHQHEIDMFEQWFANNDYDAPKILFFHDAADKAEKKGGVGKTWLLRKCANLIVQQHPEIAIVMVDFFSVAEREGVEIARRMMASLRSIHKSWDTNAFDRALEEYHEALSTNNEIAVTANLPKLHAAIVHDLTQLDQKLLQPNKNLLLFFDTYELIEQHPGITVLDPDHIFPAFYEFKHIGAVIAGRNEPSWHHPNWSGRQNEVKCVPLKPFDLAEMVQFLNENNTTNTSPFDVDNSQMKILHLRTEGRPILVGLVTDVLNHHIMSLNQLITTAPLDFESHLVTQINRLENPINWIVLFMSHVYHRFNLEMLNSIFAFLSIDAQTVGMDTPKLMSQLLKLSFVRRSGNGDNIALHDEMRRLVDTHNWPAQALNRSDLSHAVINYYEEKIASDPSKQMRQTYRVEMLYHKLFLDIDDGLKLFNTYFKQAIDFRQSSVARSFLQEARKSIGKFSPEQCYDLLFDEASLLRLEDSNVEAIALYEQLRQHASQDWLALHNSDILFELGNCYLQMSNFAAAIENFSACLELEKTNRDQSRSAYILGYLGYIYRRLGDLDQALTYAEQSLAIHKNSDNERGYADVLNSVGVIYRLQGKFDEALRRIRISLHLRNDLYAHGETSQLSVAFSLDAMGAIYFKLNDLISAKQFFDQAYQIYTIAEDKRGIASMHNRFGQIDLLHNDLPSAMHHFKEAFLVSKGIDPEQEINSLNKQGWTLVLQNQLAIAIPLFEQAIEHASQAHDYYQQAESLIDLADVFERLQLHEKSQQTLQVAETIALKYKYYYLLGLAQSFRGENLYKAGNYAQAFPYFGTWCYYMALYNPLEYEKAVRRTTDLLIELPKAEAPSSINALIVYWKSSGLAESSSPMLHALEEVKQLRNI